MHPPTPPRPDLDGIAARIKAASPGPWITCHPENAFKNWPIGFFSLGRDEEDSPKNWAITTDSICASQMTSGGAKEDAEFIAAARQDVPALVAYARSLEAKVRKAHAHGFTCGVADCLELAISQGDAVAAEEERWKQFAEAP